jgi:uncharacterized cupin superfamily protein
LSQDDWFVVNVRDAKWVSNDAFGRRCYFDREGHRFDQVGYTLAVLSPGRPSGLYHAESNQEDFLVLKGECLAIVEGEERPLRTWDFLHCPPGTKHVFVGAGGGPCLLLMVGARSTDKKIVYPVSEVVMAHRAGVEAETTTPKEAYADFPDWLPVEPMLFD